MNLQINANVLLIALAQLATAAICLSDGSSCFDQLAPDDTQLGGRPRRTGLRLEGTAKGGELVLLEMRNPNPRYLRIDTYPGESAEVVLARMAAAIVENRPFNPYQVWNVRAEGNFMVSLPGNPGSYTLAGTETGLGIPPPPTSLSASYDPDAQEVSLYWENPDESYDALGGSIPVQPGRTASLVQNAPPIQRRFAETPSGRFEQRREQGLRRFYVLGCRNGVLSNAAVITFNYQDNSQEELDTLPFTGGVAPNWKAWAGGSDKQAILLSQGTKGEWKRFDQEPRVAIEPDDRTFYQVIKSSSPEGVGGVYRKFLALKPGHTYRLWTRMNTFDLDEAQGDWAFTFHAAPQPAGITLSPEQMAGIAPLPDGESGPDAGLVAAFGPGATTRGKFVECSTGARGSHSTAADITLPDGAEVITVWFRYHGPPSAGGVGFDWIKLKDISAQ